MDHVLVEQNQRDGNTNYQCMGCGGWFTLLAGRAMPSSLGECVPRTVVRSLPKEPLPEAPVVSASIGRTLSERAWVETADLMRDTHDMMSQFPAEVDAVVGVARSGMMPAAYLATLLHVPLYAVAGKWSGQSADSVVCCGNGWRLHERDRKNPRTVLIVDDTAWHGESMQLAAPIVREAFPGSKVLRSAIYATKSSLPFLDIVAVGLNGWHYLEWNFFNAGHCESTACDMDGVLCNDFTIDEDDDGDRYREAIAARRVLQVPRRRPVAAIVTARLEKWRPETEAWLTTHGVLYDRLIMGPWQNQTERSRDDIGRWKAERYAELPDARWFVESDPAQAKRIAEISGRPVLCPELKTMIHHPRQSLGQPAPSLPKKTSVGAGSHLHALIKRYFGLDYAVGCNCRALVEEMDKNPPQWSVENMPRILEKLRSEAKARSWWSRMAVSLPGHKWPLKWLINEAVRLAEADLAIAVSGGAPT